jgi:tetratricopeptide (TPR) repeat protein
MGGQVETYQYLDRGKELLAQGDFEGALKQNQKVLSLSGNNPPGDEALFNMGLIYAHSGNPKKDYGKSIGFFKKLTKDYPQSPFVEQVRIWTGVLQENEKLNQTIQKLNQVIEGSKQVDIEIEEKKREKAK